MTRSYEGAACRRIWPLASHFGSRRVRLATPLAIPSSHRWPTDIDDLAGHRVVVPRQPGRSCSRAARSRLPSPCSSHRVLGPTFDQHPVIAAQVVPPRSRGPRRATRRRPSAVSRTGRSSQAATAAGSPTSLRSSELSGPGPGREGTGRTIVPVISSRFPLLDRGR